jgi:diguanylate cyclase (GGDEF)-like protein
MWSVNVKLHEISPPPSKRLLLIRLFAVIAATFLLVESAEFTVKSVYPQYDGLFELLEDAVLVIILFVDIYYLLARPMFKEIARRVAVEEELRKSEADNLALLDSLPDTLLRVSHDGILVDFRLESEGVMNVDFGKHIKEMFPGAVVPGIMSCLQNTLESGELQKLDIVVADWPEEHHQELRFVKYGDDEVLIIISNITDRKRYEERLKYVSTHDVLTGLYNRAFYEAQLERLGKGRHYPIGIIVIDLDGLKETNDTYGHAAGDKMICMASDVLKRVFRADDYVFRTGGDEFTMLLTETNYDALQLVVSRINTSLGEVNADKQRCALRFSLGTAIAATKELFPDAIKQADARMYEDKATRKSARKSLVNSKVEAALVSQPEV